jgi:hypothetical protein
LQDGELLGDDSAACGLALQFVHYEFCVVDLSCDVFQSLEVDVVEFEAVGGDWEEGGEEGVEGVGLEGQQVEVGVGEGEGDVGVGAVAAVLGDGGGTWRLRAISQSWR